MPVPFFTNINVARDLEEIAYKNLFEVTITLPTLLQNAYPNATHILLENCKTAPLPTYPKLGVQTQKFKYSTRFFATTPESTSLDGLQFDFELNQNVNKQLMVWDIMKNWYDLGWNNQDGTLHYKRNMIGNIVVNQHDREGKIIRRVTYFNTMMLQPTGWENLSWEESGKIDFKAEFCCDYWDDFYFSANTPT